MAEKYTEIIDEDSLLKNPTVYGDILQINPITKEIFLSNGGIVKLRFFNNNSQDKFSNCINRKCNWNIFFIK